MPARHAPTAAIATASLLAAAAAARADGPDLGHLDISAVTHYGLEGDVRAYSLGFGLCNAGDAPVAFDGLTAHHPVTAQNLYRIAGGRFEHIGMSWATHEVCALQNTGCGLCDPAGSGCPPALGALCASPTSAGGAGDRARLGPRSQVNGFTGAFPFPFTAPSFSGIAARRLQVRAADVDPAANPGAVYLAEVQSVSGSDAAAGHSADNASCRTATFSAGGGALLSGATARGTSAIHRWRDLDPAVVVSEATVPGEGRLTLACRVVASAGGTWTYNYALHNLDSDRAVGGLSIAPGCGAAVTTPGFSAPRSHSGEPYSNDPWEAEVFPGSVAWATQAYAENPDANAVRWGTAYTFWFTADTPPTAGEAVAALFLPGTPSSVTFAGVPVPSARCRADWDHSGGVASTDISAYLTAWLADVTGGGTAADVTCDGAVNSADIGAFLTAWIEAVTTGGC